MSRNIDKRRTEKLALGDFSMALFHLKRLEELKYENLSKFYFEHMKGYHKRLDQIEYQKKVDELLEEASKTIDKNNLKSIFNQIQKLESGIFSEIEKLESGMSRGEIDDRADNRAKKRLRLSNRNDSMKAIEIKQKLQAFVNGQLSKEELLSQLRKRESKLFDNRIERILNEPHRLDDFLVYMALVKLSEKTNKTGKNIYSEFLTLSKIPKQNLKARKNQIKKIVKKVKSLEKKSGIKFLDEILSSEEKMLNTFLGRKIKHMRNTATKYNDIAPQRASSGAGSSSAPATVAPSREGVRGSQSSDWGSNSQRNSAQGRTQTSSAGNPTPGTGTRKSKKKVRFDLPSVSQQSAPSRGAARGSQNSRSNSQRNSAQGRTQTSSAGNPTSQKSEKGILLGMMLKDVLKRNQGISISDLDFSVAKKELERLREKNIGVAEIDFGHKDGYIQRLDDIFPQNNIATRIKRIKEVKPLINDGYVFGDKIDEILRSEEKMLNTFVGDKIRQMINNANTYNDIGINLLILEEKAPRLHKEIVEQKNETIERLKRENRTTVKRPTFGGGSATKKQLLKNLNNLVVSGPGSSSATATVAREGVRGSQPSNGGSSGSQNAQGRTQTSSAGNPTPGTGTNSSRNPVNGDLFENHRGGQSKQWATSGAARGSQNSRSNSQRNPAQGRTQNSPAGNPGAGTSGNQSQYGDGSPRRTANINVKKLQPRYLLERLRRARRAWGSLGRGLRQEQPLLQTFTVDGSGVRGSQSAAVNGGRNNTGANTEGSKNTHGTGQNNAYARTSPEFRSNTLTGDIDHNLKILRNRGFNTNATSKNKTIKDILNNMTSLHKGLQQKKRILNNLS